MGLMWDPASIVLFATRLRLPGVLSVWESGTGRGHRNSIFTLRIFASAPGFEPTTSGFLVQCANQLIHTGWRATNTCLFARQTQQTNMIQFSQQTHPNQPRKDQVQQNSRNFKTNQYPQGEGNRYQGEKNNLDLELCSYAVRLNERVTLT